MRTEDLIAQLSGRVGVAPPHAAVRRLCLAAALGGAVAMLLLLVSLGVRPDLVTASTTAPFWMKWMFTLSLAWASVVVARRLGDPDTHVGLAWLGLAAPIAIVAMMGVGELMTAPAAQWRGLVVGSTSLRCFVAIPLLAAPVFASLLWAFQRLAPTRLRLTGATAGFFAGATAASVYALSCPEQSPAFMAVWYTGGMLSAAPIRGLVGPRFLKL